MAGREEPGRSYNRHCWGKQRTVIAGWVLGSRGEKGIMEGEIIEGGRRGKMIGGD